MNPKPIRNNREISGRGYDIRKIIHIAIGMFGFMYPFLDWETILFAWVIAFFCVWFIPPRIEALETLLTPSERRLGYSPAMISYALVMILASLIFRDTMKESAVILLSALAFGDGFSALIGSNYPGTRIPYNHQKTINGTFAFIIFGTLGALVMLFFLYSFMMHKALNIEPGALPIFKVIIVMTIAAIVETIPWRMPDNIPIGIVGIITLLATMHLYR